MKKIALLFLCFLAFSSLAMAGMTIAKPSHSGVQKPGKGNNSGGGTVVPPETTINI